MARAAQSRVPGFQLDVALLSGDSRVSGDGGQREPVAVASDSALGSAVQER